MTNTPKTLLSCLEETLSLPALSSLQIFQPIFPWQRKQREIVYSVDEVKEKAMTNCPICNREKSNDWCKDCINNDREDDRTLIAEWAADRAREFERNRTNKLIDDLEAKVERLTSDRAGWKQVDAILQIMDTAKVFATSGPPDWRALSAVEQVQSLVDERDALQSEVERIKADKEKQAIKETSEPFDYRDNMRLGWAPKKVNSQPTSEQEREAIVKLLKFYEEKINHKLMCSSLGDTLYAQQQILAQMQDKIEAGEHWPEGGEG